MTATPTRRKKRLGRFLRALRDASGLNAADAAAVLKTQESTVSRYEAGFYRPQWPSVESLLRLYKASDDDWRRALHLWESASVPTYQVRLPAGTPKTFRELVRIEREANRVLTIGPSVFPGFLQTSDYARAVHAAAHRSRTPEANVEDFVSARMERQTLLDGPEALTLDVCLDQVVLVREVGGRDVLRGQLEHVLAVMEKPNVTVRIIPFGAGAYGSMSGACSIMVFEELEESAVVYLEHAAGAAWVENEGDVQHFEAMFEDVRAIAMSPEDTAEMIHAQVRRLSR